MESDSNNSDVEEIQISNVKASLENKQRSYVILDFYI